MFNSEPSNVQDRESVSDAFLRPRDSRFSPPAALPEGLKADHFVAYAEEIRGSNLSLAARHLYQALLLEPDHARANQLLAAYFFHAGLIADALGHIARASAAAPDDPEIASDHALVLDAQGMTDDALALIRGQFARGRFTAALVARFARLAPKTGCEAEALEMVRRVLREPRLTPRQRKALHFEASKLLDRMKRYDEAFEHARLMHAAAPLDFDPNAFRATVAQHMGWFTKERLRSIPAATHGWGQPVFIVGMPRSGTSLVEQILDSHPAVFGGGELMDLPRVVRQAVAMGGGNYVGCFTGPEPARRFDALAGLYLSRVGSFAPGARYITDKLPVNWLHLGLISKLFPQAHVIHLVRDPLDTCLSCYMTHFVDSTPYTGDLTHLGMHFNDHRTMMSHWRDVLDLPILDVSYEALVADPEAQVRRIVSFLDLPWDERCLSFHQNARVVGTASMDQVRQPMYRSSVGRWKNYERHLAPLVRALGGAAAP